MKPLALRLFSTLVFCFAFFAATAQQKEVYQCTPCGNDCDIKTFKREGNCPHCHMKLVKKSAVQYKSIQPSEVCPYLKQHPETVILDVRTKEEFEGSAHPEHGTFRNAINIPIQELDSRLSELEKYKDREMIVYCSHSKRSPRASYLLVQNGFSKVTNMEGGMSVLEDNDCIIRRK